MLIKYDGNGKGYRIGRGIFTTFQERFLFLRCGSNDKADERAAASQAGPNKNCSSASGFKRKNKNPPENKFINEAARKSKRVKNGSNDASDSSGNDKVERSVEDLLFSNELLLRVIFANLNVEDLKHCRLVNSLWNLEAAKILLNRDCLKAIEITNNTVTVHDTAEHRKPTGLQGFESIVTNSKLFPFSFFAVNSSMLGNDAVNFFGKTGHLVKSLCFETVEDKFVDVIDATTGDVLLLAATCFPNLTKLQLEHADEKPTCALTLLAIKHVPDLANLHTLEITGPFPEDAVALLLKKAINLQNIYLHPEEVFDWDYNKDLEKLMKLGNVIPRLRNIYLIFSEGVLEVYREVLKQNPRFSSIGSIIIEDALLEGLEMVEQIITAVLRQCSESLTEMLDVKCFEFFPGLSCPKFLNVKRLEIEAERLSSGINLAQVFPSLKTLEVSCSGDYEPKDPVHGPLGPSLSVRHLQVTWGEGRIPEIWAKKLCSLTPNITSAKFCNPFEDSAYEYVWKLNKLQDLHLEISTQPKENLFSALDSAFTGFSVGMAKQLYNIIDTAYFALSAEDIESVRIKPSIVDLIELKNLSLRLFDKTVNHDRQFLDARANNYYQKNVQVLFEPGNGNGNKALLQMDGQIILSVITKRFGFDLCPRLNSNVSVGFTHYTINYDVEKRESD